MATGTDFVLNKSMLLKAAAPTSASAAAVVDPIQGLLGTWTGVGFNTIWRPQQGAVDNVLQLNATTETLVFSPITGTIPNRGIFQPDIFLTGISYLQQITDANTLEGIHLEPGIWLTVPSTTNPAEPQSVVRMASIPHGTTLLAQGAATTTAGPPVIPSVDITPFPIGNPANKIPFPGESNLSVASANRIPSPAQPQTPPLTVPITQAMVNNPNSVLTAALAGKTVLSTTTLSISTLVPSSGVTAGGGTSNIAFLQGTSTANANANAVRVDATFWLETIQTPGGSFMQLQYTQTVFLNFNGLTWPHVSVATLTLKPIYAVKFAVYGGIGSGGTLNAAANVQQALQNLLNASNGKVAINNVTMGGDPAPFIAKQFAAVVNVNGVDRNFACQEGQTINFNS